MPEKERLELRNTTSWRLHLFFRFSEAARRIRENRKLIELTSLIFGETSIPDATINFNNGSRQHLHQVPGREAAGVGCGLVD